MFFQYPRMKKGGKNLYANNSDIKRKQKYNIWRILILKKHKEMQ